MDPDYARRAVERLRQHGFRVERVDRVLGEGTKGQPVVSEAYCCARGTAERLTLEIVHRADQSPEDADYYLELRFGAISSPSFGLDSWKVGEDSIEFRYLAGSAMGRALTFTLLLA